MSAKTSPDAKHALTLLIVLCNVIERRSPSLYAPIAKAPAGNPNCNWHWNCRGVARWWILMDQRGDEEAVPA